MDTGYRPHADLVANILPGYDFIVNTFTANDGGGRDTDASDPGDAVAAGECGVTPPNPQQYSSWHGTHVAGTIAAVANNAMGVAGIAFNAKILPVRVLGKCGGYVSDITDGIRWAAGINTVIGVPSNPNPAKVINLSLGSKLPSSCDPTYVGAINDARSVGATVVVAAGNLTADAGSYSPGNCAGVITVAATDRNGVRAPYSNYGTAVEISAPGGNVSGSYLNGIYSTLNSGYTSPVNDSYAFYQGTSMAAPHVSGAAALLYSVKPTISPDEVYSVLASNARKFPVTGGTNDCNNASCGAGILDAGRSVSAVAVVANPVNLPWLVPVISLILN